MYKPESELYALAQRNRLRRDFLAFVGRKAFKMLLNIQTKQREKEYPLFVCGRENIPGTAAIIVAPHITRQDVALHIEAVGRYANPFATIDGEVSKKRLVFA